MLFRSCLAAALILTIPAIPFFGPCHAQELNSTGFSGNHRGESADSVLRVLVTSAATDFHNHGPSGTLRFRDVRFGRMNSPGAGHPYLLCGQFIRAGQGRSAIWTRFVTIKTSGYEQWIGAQADAFCRDSTVIWYNRGNLTSTLQHRLDGLK